MEEPGITTNQFSKSLLGCEVHFYILKLEKSFLLWIGTDPSFKTLAVAMNSRLVSDLLDLHEKCPLTFVSVHSQDSQPIGSQLLGDSRNMASLNLSKQLGMVNFSHM